MRDPAAHDRVAAEFRREPGLDRVDEREVGGGDGNAGFHAAREAGLRRQALQVGQPEPACQRVHVRFGDSRVDIRVHDALLRRGAQARSKVAQIVTVGSRRDGVGGQAADARIEIRLAVIAAVDGVGAVALVRELAGIEDDQRPAMPRGMRLDPPARGDRHRGSRCVVHRCPGPRVALGDMRERHRIHAPAHREGEPVMPVELRDQPIDDFVGRGRGLHSSSP